MKIAIAADHAGYLLKEALREKLTQAGHQVTDFGTASAESTDYPDYAAKVATGVSGGGYERGVLVCSTGVGMSIAANKVEGVRCALGYMPEEVRLSRAHNDANVLALGARFLDAERAGELVDTFLSTGFDGGRHARRVAKIAVLEGKDAGAATGEGG